MQINVKDYPAGFYPQSLLDLTWGDGNSTLYRYLGVHADVQPIEENIRVFFDISKRQQLYDVFVRQYSGVELTESQKVNLASLKNENAFTVTTGQQIHVGLGPMYVWNKIESVLNTVDVLSAQHIQNHYVPVFWMATEDHDFEEIKDLVLFGEKYTWETEQTGPVGLFHTQELKLVFEKIQERFINDQSATLNLKKIEAIYLNAKNLAEATRNLVQMIFGETGLLVLDPNDHTLKSMAQNCWKRDVLFRGKCDEKGHVGNLETFESQKQLMLQYGVEAQAYPREINCFYLEKGVRERIESTAMGYIRVNSKIEYSETEMVSMIENYPECMSPNVLLRPIYQQSILPNVVYIGGPAEVKYWIQCAPMFDIHGIVMPRLQLRLSNIYVPGFIEKKIGKLGFEITDFWQSWPLMENRIVEIQEDKYHLDSEIEALSLVYEKIWQSLYSIQSKELKDLKKSHLESIKSLKRISTEYKSSPNSISKLSKDIQMARSIKEKYFDDSKPQERTLFWLEIYLTGVSLNSRISKTEYISFLEFIGI
jgi:bacillithiol biosynthesis cysteine-adding enzyme BshC